MAINIGWVHRRIWRKVRQPVENHVVISMVAIPGMEALSGANIDLIDSGIIAGIRQVIFQPCFDLPLRVRSLSFWAIDTRRGLH